MIMTFNELVSNLLDYDQSPFPYDEELTLPHIKENGNIEMIRPLWYDYLLNTDVERLTRYANKKYKSLLVENDFLPNFLDYKDTFTDFLYGVNETMYRYLDLFTQHNNPYHNVDEDTTVTTTYGETLTTTNIDTRKTTQDFDDTKSTEKVGKYGQDSNTLKNTDNSEITTDGRQDVTTTDSAEDKITIAEHTDSVHTVRGGNIGVTTNKTLAFEQIDYAHAMKLYDLFLKEYFEFFGCGVWGC